MCYFYAVAMGMMLGVYSCAYMCTLLRSDTLVLSMKCHAYAGLLIGCQTNLTMVVIQTVKLKPWSWGF